MAANSKLDRGLALRWTRFSGAVRRSRCGSIVIFAAGLYLLVADFEDQYHAVSVAYCQSTSGSGVTRCNKASGSKKLAAGLGRVMTHVSLAAKNQKRNRVDWIHFDSRVPSVVFSLDNRSYTQKSLFSMRIPNPICSLMNCDLRGLGYPNMGALN